MEQTVSAEKLESMLRKVQALLATADHPNTPPHEADTARNMAEALMLRYRIDEATMGPADPSGLNPVWKNIVICDASSEYALSYASIMRYVVHHCGCRMKLARADVDGQRCYVAEVVGYPSDLSMTNMLWTSMMLGFQVKVEPKYDRSLPERVNAYNMRKAGMEGRRIALAIYGRDDKALRPKVRKMFKDESLARGEDPAMLLGKGNSMESYRASFAKGFTDETRYRLSSMRASRGESGIGLVLASRGENVNEAFYVKYPDTRPSQSSSAGYIDPRANCPRCKAAKSGYCREHSWMKPRMVRTSARNEQGYQQGATAARTVDVGRGGTSKLGNEPKGEI